MPAATRHSELSTRIAKLFSQKQFTLLLQLAYRHIRWLTLMVFLIVFGLLHYYSNVQIVARLGLPPIELPRTLGTVLLIIGLVVGVDQIYQRLIPSGKLWPMILMILASSGIITILRAGLDWGLQAYFAQESGILGTRFYWVQLFFATLLVPIGILPLQVADSWIKRKRLTQALGQQELAMKTQQLEAEIRFLKAQLHPHFLFNVLNNLYSLIPIDSHQAQEVVLKLSGMMQYMLYESSAPLVSLEKEVRYLQQYIDLFQLKKDGEMNLRFEVSGSVQGWQIPPMLLVPLFENVFKHGNLENLQQGWMEAHLSCTPAELRLTIANSVGRPTASRDLPGGIGLPNTQERLALHYPDQHALDIRSEVHLYAVSLHLFPDPHSNAPTP